MSQLITRFDCHAAVCLPYYITVRNVYEFKKQLVKSGLVWSSVFQPFCCSGTKNNCEDHSRNPVSVS